MLPDILRSYTQEIFRQLHAMIKKAVKLQSLKNGSNFVCEKGTFSQIR